MKKYFNIENQDNPPYKGIHRGILPPKDSNDIWLTNQEPPTPTPSTPTPPSPGDGSDGKCPKCHAVMHFEPVDGWSCEDCNEVYPIPKGKCPQCGVGSMGNWEEFERDAWNSSTERHYTEPTGIEYRTCDRCGYEQDQEHYSQKNDPDYHYELMRDNQEQKDRLASYFGAKKEAAGEHPSKGEGYKCMTCGKQIVTVWGPTMCAECAKKEDKKAGSYFDLAKTAQWFDKVTNQSNNEIIPCNKCRKTKSDVEERYSFGIYAGKMCCECAYKGYRDHCGLIKSPSGKFSEGNQGNPTELEEMGERIEPEDRDYYKRNY